MTQVTLLLRRLWRYEPMRHAHWEIILLRAALVWVAWGTFIGDSTFLQQPHPNGVAQWMDLTWLSDDRWEGGLRLSCQISLLLYVVGVPAVLSLLAPVFLGIGWFTLKNSQGAIGHSYQVVHLVLLGIWLANLLGLMWRKRADDLNRAQLEMHWARQALMAGYVVSALTKLLQSGGWWFRDSHYFALHLVKNQDMKYYGTLDENLRRLEWLPDLMLQNPLLAQLFFGLALPLELLAFVACRNRWLALLFGLALVAFHASVKQLTLLDFQYNSALLLVLMVQPWWWVVRGVGALRKKPTSL